MIVKRIAWLGLLAAVGFGCEASNADGLVEPVIDSEAKSEAQSGAQSEWSSGCYWDCPDCNGDTCGMCDMVCPGGVFCGDGRCEVDEVCCDSACGICAQPGATCDRSACLQPPECSKDEHCNVAADYCVGCDCVALGPEEKLPACPGVGVECAKDPCDGKKAVCQNNRCVIE